jgi:Type VII secretion system ESX-1, transport TM domain B
MDMARGQGAQLEASGRRFQTRRLIHALVRGDVAMVDEPIRAQSISYASGWLAALLAVAVCAVIAIAAPAGGPGDAPVVMARDTGALYVRIGSTWLSGVRSGCVLMFPVRRLSSLVGKRERVVRMVFPIRG